MAREDDGLGHPQAPRKLLQPSSLGSIADDPELGVMMALIELCEGTNGQVKTLPMEQSSDTDDAQAISRARSFARTQAEEIALRHCPLRVNQNSLRTEFAEFRSRLFSDADRYCCASNCEPKEGICMSSALCQVPDPIDDLP